MDRTASSSTQFCLTVGENRAPRAVAASVSGEDIYGSCRFQLFGRGLNRVMKTACFDANVQ